MYSLLLAALPLQVSEARQGSETVPPSIPRFSQVTDGLYRGGQPDRAGLEWLKRKGIRTIINLQTKGERERTVVEQLGMKYIHIPVSLVTEPIGIPLNPWKRLPEEAVHAFLRAESDPANVPVFVHCRRGADRTGVMVALYRIAFQRWDAEQAYREARDKGLSWWFRGVKRQVRELAEKQATGAGPGSLAARLPVRGRVNLLPAPCGEGILPPSLWLR